MASVENNSQTSLTRKRRDDKTAVRDCLAGGGKPDVTRNGLMNFMNKD